MTTQAQDDVGQGVFLHRERRGNTMMGYGYGGHMSGWGWAVMGVGSVLLWVALGLGVLALARHLWDSAGTLTRAGHVDPTQLLAARYARGDIGDEEYHRRLDTLRSRSSSEQAR